MLVNFGNPWVILGHSERRLILNETNEVSCFLVTHNFLSFGHCIWFIIDYCFMSASFSFYLLRFLLSNNSHSPCFLFQFVGEKVAYALSKGLKVIACVGETLEQWESGTTVEVVATQTKAIAGTWFTIPYVFLFMTFCWGQSFLYYTMSQELIYLWSSMTHKYIYCSNLLSLSLFFVLVFLID